jgi:hypothetical protein
METIKVIDIIGSPSAISPRAGLKAYDFVASELKQHHSLHVNFDGVTDLTSAFCNSFIGKLYMNFDKSLLDDQVHINGIDKDNIWYKKIQSAIYLGTNEKARNLHNSNLNDIISA